MKTLLWVGDAGCPSGFARATHKILETLYPEWETTVLGLNYRGDPHPYPYPLYVAAVEGDAFGVNRIVWMCDKIRIDTGNPPDLIVLQNDPWNIPAYVKRIKSVDEYKNIPIVGYIAVDGLNCRGSDLNGLDLAIFWTRFAEQEAKEGGLTKPSAVVSLGVDRSVYYPGDKIESRRQIGIPEEYINNMFIIGNVNRNQPRKRLDLSIAYFTEWIATYNVLDALLFLHVAPTGDNGYDIKQLARYYAFKFNAPNRVIWVTPEMWYGYTEEMLRMEYCSFDLMLTTSQGEGMGLPTLEGMACGIPQIAGDWAAYHEWGYNSIKLINCPNTIATDRMINSIGGIMDRQLTIDALDELYRSPEVRESYRQSSLELVQDPKFDWKIAGQRFNQHIKELVPELVSA